MKATLQLYTNIQNQKELHRRKNREIDTELGYKTGAFAVKMTRLKQGNTTVVTAKDIALLMKLFGCKCNVLFVGVDFGGEI